MTGFTLHEIKERGMFDAAVDVHWEAFHTPFRAEFPWLHPVYGFTDADRATSVQRDKDRRWAAHKSDPSSVWLAVTADATGEVVGVGEWQVHTSNPFPDGPTRLQCTWFPEGETRDFVTEILNQCFYARMNWMDRPHISLNQMGTLPAWRRRGVGSLIMEWGVRKAEELQLECFIEASESGRDLYEHFDFRPLMTCVADMRRKTASQDWERLQHQFPPIVFTFMWRPAPRDLGEGKEVSFWDIVKGRVQRD